MISKTLRDALRALTILSLAACGGSEGGPSVTEPEAPRPTSVDVSPKETAFTFLGQSATLRALILDQNGKTFTGTPTWSSSNAGVVSVSATGAVTAVGNGTATVTASIQSISASATVTVAQEVSALSIVSGNDQTAISGEALATPVVVKATDAGGAAVAGVTVTFTPSDLNGSVNPASAVTNESGEASTTWTLGSKFGGQSLVASVGSGVIATIGARAMSVTPIPDLVTGGTMVIARPDPGSLETVTAQVTVRNDGDAATGGTFRVRLSADGTEIATEVMGPLDPGAFQTSVFTVGPFSAGAHSLSFDIDVDEVIAEGDEGNNTLVRNLAVLQQTAVEAGSLAGLSGTEDQELLFRLDLPIGSPSILTFELTGGSGDVDLFVEAGARPTNRTQYDDCLSTSPTTEERCQIGEAQPGVYNILLHAFSTFSGVTMTITLGGEVLPFDIELVFIDNGTATQDQAVRDAAARWMEIIPLDIPNSDFSVDPLGANECVDGQPLVTDVVDDLRIYVVIEEIDGPSGTLAQAGPCVTRGLTNLPIVASMRFDSADLETLEGNGGLLSVILHEMGHALGIGTIWRSRGLLQNPSLPSSAGADTHFNGPLAIAAFNAAGGSNYTLGKKVPVENTAGEGSSDSHWRETLLTVELMTPFFQSGQTNPLSAISIQSLADVGYKVDVTKADPYSGSFSLAAARAPGGVPPVVLDLGDDVRRGPVYVVDEKGKIVRVDYH